MIYIVHKRVCYVNCDKRNTQYSRVESVVVEKRAVTECGGGEQQSLKR